MMYSTRKFLSVAAIALAFVGLVAVPYADAALVNQYNNAPGTWVDGGGPGGALGANPDGVLDQGDGSTNITTTQSGSLGSLYDTANLVDGNFAGFSPGPGQVGGALQVSGFYGHTTDPDPHMWITGGATDEQYVAFSFTDSSYQFDEMRVWNGNEIQAGGGAVGADRTGRGVQDMWVWYSDAVALPAILGVAGGASPGAGWTMAVGPGASSEYTLTQAPGLGTYDGETLGLGGFTARHMLFSIDSNWDGGGLVALSEVQFFGTLIPEPSTFVLLVLGALVMPVVGRRRRRA